MFDGIIRVANICIYRSRIVYKTALVRTSLYNALSDKVMHNSL